MRNAGEELGKWPSTLVCLLFLSITQISFATQLTFLDTAIANGAVCLDGSPPAFQFDRGFTSGVNNWLIHLEGGGWCTSNEECKNRIVTGHGSSIRMIPYKMTGILSNKRLYNPNFYNWNRILVRYCDGSSYTGDVEAVDPVYNLHYRGQRIFNALMDHFMQIGMKNASKAILTGCSAGGVGSILHCDQFRSLFSVTTKVKCIADGAFFIHTKDIAGNYFMEGIFDGVVNLHGSAKNLPQSCTSKMKPSSCFLPVNAVPTVKTPIFIVNSFYDTWQLSINLASNKADTLKLWSRCKFNVTECSRSQVKTLKEFMKEFVRQVQAGVGKDESRGMFINSCRTHCQTEFQPKWLGDNRSTLNSKQSINIFYISNTPLSSLFFLEKGSARIQYILHHRLELWNCVSDLYLTILDGYNQKQLQFHVGDSIRSIRRPKLQRPKHTQALQHWNFDRQTYGRELPQAQKQR